MPDGKDKEIKVKIFHITSTIGAFQGEDKYYIERVEDFERKKLIYTITRLSPLGNKIVDPKSNKFKELVIYIEQNVYGKEVKFKKQDKE